MECHGESLEARLGLSLSFSGKRSDNTDSIGVRHENPVNHQLVFDTVHSKSDLLDWHWMLELIDINVDVGIVGKKTLPQVDTPPTKLKTDGAHSKDQWVQQCMQQR